MTTNEPQTASTRPWFARTRAFLRSKWSLVAGAVLGCALVGAAVGAVSSPPGGVEADVTTGAKVGTLVIPADLPAMQRAHVPRSNVAASHGAAYWHGPGEEYGGWIFASANNPEAALNFSAGAAILYAQDLTRHENELMRARKPPPPILKRQRALMREPARFRVVYAPQDAVAPPASFPHGPWRTGLIGALVGALLVGLGWQAAKRRAAPAIAASPGDGSGPGILGSSAFATAAWMLSGLVSAGLLAALASSSSAAFMVVLVGLLFAFAFAITRAGGYAAIRLLVAFVIVISALRGALLGLSNTINLPDGLTIVNAIQPAIIAGCALAVLVERRGRFPRDAWPLLAGWVLFAGAAILDLATETVGLKAYGLGLAQYLVYPTLAVLAWLSMRRGDAERFVRLFVVLGTVVAVSVFIESIGLVKFVEAADPQADIAVGSRYGGTTGSFLHASIFMGTAAVLAMALVLRRWREREGLAAAAALAMMFGGISLTLTRGGFVIAAIGFLALLVGGTKRDRIRMLGASVAILAVALVVGTAGGISPAHVASRLGSGLNASGDPGNQDRFTTMKNALDHYAHMSLPTKALGAGIASTGNISQLTEVGAVRTESYVLKLLIEVGIVGTILIGGYLAWAAYRFTRNSIRGPDGLARAVGAAGLGLSAWALIYPTLQAQILAMAWWLLLAACLTTNRIRRGERRIARQDGTGPRRADGRSDPVGHVSGREGDWQGPASDRSVDPV